MGKLQTNIFGGFSGKVGSVVGSSWRGISYMRALPRSGGVSHTPSQLMQRGRFKAAVSFLKPLNAAIRIGWRGYASGKLPFHAALSHTIKNAVSGVYPNYFVDASKALVSAGWLTGAADAVAVETDGGARLHWADNSFDGAAKPSDCALVAVANFSRAVAVVVYGDAVRGDCGCAVAFPALWRGDEMCAYLGFTSADGKEISNSIFLNFYER